MHWTEPAPADDSHAALEKTLWDAANQLWSNAALKPSEYSSTVLGLIFKKGAQASRLFFPRLTAKMAVPPFYARASIARLIAEILEPYHGRTLDPTYGCVDGLKFEHDAFQTG